MDPTEEEADFPNSSMGLAPARPPLFPLRHNKPSAQKRSNPLIDLETNSYKVPSSLTGPPSPSASGIVGSIFDTNSILASSSWPQRVEESYSFPLSTFLSSTSPRNSEAVVEEEKRTPLPPISQSCRSNSSLIPRLSGPSLPPSSSPPSSPTPPSEQTDVGSRSFLLKPPTVDWDEFASRSSDPLNRKDKVALWAAIQVAGVPIYLSNPGFDAFSLCPSASGTYCSPTALLATFSDVEVFYHAYAAGKKLSREDLVPPRSDSDGGVLRHAADVVLAEYGTALIEQNTGPHFTFINVGRDSGSNTIVRRARQLVQRFQENGITKDKIVVSIPATEEGIHATRLLSKDGILVNSAMVTGMSHAAACAEAGAVWITFHLDKLEKVYEDRGEHLQGIEAIQSTIALFDIHKVNTKVMISGFLNPWKILEFPGAHGFSLTTEQIVAAQVPTTQSCRVPPQSPSSLPENAIILAKEAKWPPQFFDATEAGGSNGFFVRYFSSRLQTVLLTTQSDLFCHTRHAIRDFLTVVQEDVVNYRRLMIQLSDPRTGLRTVAREGVKGLRRMVNQREGLRGAEEWTGTLVGRFLPKVEWGVANVEDCDAWITADGRVEAQIPEQWYHREAASPDIYEEY